MHGQFVHNTMAWNCVPGCASNGPSGWPCRHIHFSGGQHVHSKMTSMEYSNRICCRFLIRIEALETMTDDDSMTDLYRDSTSAAASTSEHRLCGACHRCLATVRCTFCRAVARIESSALIAKKSVHWLLGCWFQQEHGGSSPCGWTSTKPT